MVFLPANKAGRWPSTNRLFIFLKYPLDLYQQIFQFGGSKQMKQYIVVEFDVLLLKTWSR